MRPDKEENESTVHLLRVPQNRASKGHCFALSSLHIRCGTIVQARVASCDFCYDNADGHYADGLVG